MFLRLYIVQVKDEDSLPPIICHRCVYKLDVLHNFREVSHKSDVILKQYLDYAKQLSSHDDQVLVEKFFFFSFIHLIKMYRNSST